MNIYVRKRNSWINFVHNVSELKLIIESYIPGTKITIGDLSQFNRPMRYALLKFVEEYPEIDLYSSTDISDSILISRAVSIIKDPIVVRTQHSLEDYKESNKDMMSVHSNLSMISPCLKLRCTKRSNRLIQLISEI